MGWNWGSTAVLTYAIFADDIPHPPSGFFLLTDLTNLLLTDNTPLETAGA